MFCCSGHTRFLINTSPRYLDLSYEAYYDQQSVTTTSGYGPSDIEQHGLTLVDHCYDIASDTYCYIAFNAERNKLFVAFRGTSSKRHWGESCVWLYHI